MSMPAHTRDVIQERARLKREVKRLRAALQRLTPGLPALLNRRGFSIYKQGPAEDLLVPAKQFQAGYYRMLHKYSFRLLLRDVIKHRDLLTLEQAARYATPAVTKKYLDYLRTVGILRKTKEGHVLARGPVTSFGETLEWYIAEVFRREFDAEAAWGVKFKRPRVGGDYDVLAKLDGSLFCVEVKSSPPKQIDDGEIAAFLDRVADLSPECAIFLMDTELRMKDKIVPMFERELANRSVEPPPVARMERELFSIQNRIFIINAKEDIVQNIRKVVSAYYRTRNA